MTHDDDDKIILGEPDVISRKAMEDLKKGRNIKDLSHLVTLDDYWEDEELGLESYKHALRKMARDYIESLREEVNWGEHVDGKWIEYPYPITEEILDMFINDYLKGTENFFYGKIPPGSKTYKNGLLVEETDGSEACCRGK